MEMVTDFILGGSKIIAEGDCSHEIERHLHDNGETDIVNKLMDMGRGKERVRCMERVT